MARAQPAHHWRIAEPDGSPTVEGRCVDCGASRVFVVAFHEEVNSRGRTELQLGTRRGRRQPGERK